jgi:ComF family protein
MSYLDDFFSLIYPNTCAGCGNPLRKHETVICNFCAFHLPVTDFHLDKENPVTQLFWGRVRLESASSFLYFNKGNTVQHLIHLLKYKGRKDIGIWLGKQFASLLKASPFFIPVDAILPVPLHPKKLKIRGFNQSEQIALGIHSAWDIPIITDALCRTTSSETQTKKTRFRRWQNVENIFAVCNAEKIAGKHILLVDDVVTTGATLESCITVLGKIPSLRVSLATLAVALD